MPNNKCFACGRFASTTDGAKCTKCSHLFHRQCVNINNDNRKLNKWQCQDCKTKTCASAASNTPNSSSSVNTDTDYGDALPNAADRGHHEDLNLTNELKYIREQLTTIVNEMVACRKEMSIIRSHLSELDHRVGDVETRVSYLEQCAADSEKRSPNCNMEDTITELRCQLNDRDQEAFLNDVEISGVPEIKGENPLHIITMLATKIGVDLDEREVVSVSRRGMRRTAIPGAEAPKPRSIVVCLARRVTRDKLLHAARVRRKADTAGLDISTEPRRFYVNERLTRTNRQLFYKAREEGRRKGWRFIWTRDGNIFVRRNSEAPRHRIRSEADLLKTFGV